MIVTLSPAKLMDFSKSVKIKAQTRPLYVKEANYLVDKLKDYSMEELGGLMGINLKQAFDVYQYIHSFHIDKTAEKPAAFAYNGIAYKGLNIKSFSEKKIEYAQQHLIILSGLYGALRPLDVIKPYRLEMQIKLENEKGTNLYDFWAEKLTYYLVKALKADDKIWLNLMSNEYTKAINTKLFPKGIQVITPNFKEQTSTGYRQVVVHTKKARGLMARFILKAQITNIEDIKAFDYEGYSYSPHLSKEKEWVFVR